MENQEKGNNGMEKTKSQWKSKKITQKLKTCTEKTKDKKDILIVLKIY